MAALQGRVGMRVAAVPVGESVCRDVGAMLQPMLLETLHPQTFSGTIGLSIHFKDGVLCHIRQLDNEDIAPGAQKKASGQTASQDVSSVLNSAIVDLREKLQPIKPGYFGIVTLTIELEAGICRKVNWDRERIHQRNEIVRQRTN